MYRTVFEITKNTQTQHSGRLRSAFTSLCALLSPMRAWSASALVATALFTLSGQPAQAQEAPALPSDPVGAPPVSELRELGESIARGESPALPKEAEGVGRSATFANTPWGIYTLHLKDITLGGGGPNGPDTQQWTYLLALRSNGTAELYGETDLSQYPGYGTTNCISRGITNIGPSITANWRVKGSTLWIWGHGYNWQDDSCEPGWHIYQPFSNEWVSFTYQFYAGFTAVRLTYTGPGHYLPPQEGNTFIFQKYRSF